MRNVKAELLIKCLYIFVKAHDKNLFCGLLQNVVTHIIQWMAEGFMTDVLRRVCKKADVI